VNHPGQLESPGVPVRVAAAQFYSGPDVAKNLDLALSYVHAAANDGARLLVMPENSNRVRDFDTPHEAYEKAELLDGEFVSGLRAAAKEAGIMLAVGVDLRGPSAPEAHIAQILIDASGEILHVHRKSVLWDYEYALYVPGSDPGEVIDTPIGRIGMLLCAEGIVPEVPRVHALQGADILVNSLNSRGPDEMRVHEPLRAIENHVWHIAANTVSGPEDAYPWTGGSQIISPTGEVLANAGESEPGLVVAEIDPSRSRSKCMGALGDLADFRRPDLYGDLTGAVDSHAVTYGPVDQDAPEIPVTVATLQLSWYHSTRWTITRAVGQIEYAATRGARLGVFPKLFVHRRGDIEADPAGASELSAEVLRAVSDAARDNRIWVVVSLVEAASGKFYSTAYLLDDSGNIAAQYRKAHLNPEERAWATAGDELVVAHTPIGRIGLMIGDEVWLPEVARILSLRGAEIIAHPADWDRSEAATMAAVERTEENRVHLVSATRIDNVAGVGSQVVNADRFRVGQPIALIRYPTTITSRHGFEENIFYRLDLQDARSKMMGHYLDPLLHRQPRHYDALVKSEQFVWTASTEPDTKAVRSND